MSLKSKNERLEQLLKAKEEENKQLEVDLLRNKSLSAKYDGSQTIKEEVDYGERSLEEVPQDSILIT